MSAAADRMARTRLAIIEQVHVTRYGRSRSRPPSSLSQSTPPPPPSGRTSLRDSAHRWWQGHPARAASELVTPLLADWGRRHPLRWLALSAATGAALVVVRPWRLVSISGLLLAALKSPQLSSLAMAALLSRGSDAEIPPPQRSTP